MAELDRVIAEAVSKQDAPFLVAMVGRRDGVAWSGAAGERSAGQAADIDTVFRIFSMSKAVGSMAAMILVDRGLLSADATVESILPEFVEIKLLEGFGQDGPRLRSPRTKATVRHLATHTSGLVYEFWNADMPRGMEATKAPTILSGLVNSLHYPLQFEPGTRWDYGVGIDWLGRVVEKIDGRRIDRFCREEIFAPLDMPDTHFEVEPHLAARLASVSMRGEDGRFADFELAPPANPEFYGMGHALYSTAPDFMRFLRMVLNRGALDGRRILSEAGITAMLCNQIGDVPVGRLKSGVPALSADVNSSRRPTRTCKSIDLSRARKSTYRRHILSTLGAAIAGAALAACGGASAETTRPTTFVLVHGSWHAAWCFGALRPWLEAAGHPVIARDLPGRGLNARFPLAYSVQPRPPAFATEVSPVAAVVLKDCVDAVSASVENAIAQGSGPMVLRGHSSGGIIIQAVAEALGPTKVKRLVYLAAWMPANGKSVLDLLGAPEEADNLAAPLILADPGVVGALRIDPNSSDAAYAAKARAAFYADVPEATVAAVFNLLTPDDPVQPYAAVAAVTAARWGAIPRTVIKGLQDRAVRPRMIDKMVTDADAFTPNNKTQVLTLETSHSPFLSQPKALADLLLALA